MECKSNYLIHPQYDFIQVLFIILFLFHILLQITVSKLDL